MRSEIYAPVAFLPVAHFSPVWSLDSRDLTNCVKTDKSWLGGAKVWGEIRIAFLFAQKWVKLDNFKPFRKFTSKPISTSFHFFYHLPPSQFHTLTLSDVHSFKLFSFSLLHIFSLTCLLFHTFNKTKTDEYDLCDEIGDFAGTMAGRRSSYNHKNLKWKSPNLQAFPTFHQTWQICRAISTLKCGPGSKQAFSLRNQKW